VQVEMEPRGNEHIHQGVDAEQIDLAALDVGDV
jgi:hypothetical protein